MLKIKTPDIILKTVYNINLNSFKIFFNLNGKQNNVSKCHLKIKIP
jgi:hypothetical protein